MTHWASRYIGMPYCLGADGSSSHDCWSLVRCVMADQYGIDVPVINLMDDSLLKQVRAFEAHEERGKWLSVSEPQEGDCVLLSHATHPHHAGIWIEADEAGVLHALGEGQSGIGVVFTAQHALRWQGWGHLEFYRHVSRNGRPRQ